MIIVKLQGGIGNQFFQYAFARHLSLKLNSKLYFDVTYYEYVRNRRFILDQFSTQGKVFGPVDDLLFFPVTLPVIGSAYQHLYSILPTHHIHTVKESKSFFFSKKLLESTGDVYIDGFWQDPRYFEKILPVVRSELQCTRRPSKKVAAYQRKMSVPGSVSIHVRRGDYTKLDAFGTCSVSYYAHAIAQIEKNVKNPRYFLFSDDLEWVKRNFDFLYNCTYVENVGDEIDDFVLQSACHHHIIANSTFSWWAALLAQDQKGVTIAPRPWVNYEQHETRTLYQKNWIVLQRDE